MGTKKSLINLVLILTKGIAKLTRVIAVSYSVLNGKSKEKRKKEQDKGKRERLL